MLNTKFILVTTPKDFGEAYLNSNLRKKRNIMRKRGLLKKK